MESGKLEGSLEENVLTLLCYSPQHYLAIRNKIGTSAMFTMEAFAQIAGVAVDYIDRYNAPPSAHLEELLSLEIAAKPSGMLARTVLNMADNFAKMNPSYVLDSLDKFMRLSRLRIAVEGAYEALADDDADGAEAALVDINTRPSVDDHGIFLHETAKILQIINQRREQEELFSTGIDALDRIGYGFARRTLSIILARMGVGKSWMCIGIGKANWMQRRKVLHITLEMERDQVLTRYLQAFFGLTEQQAQGQAISLPSIRTNELGQMTRVDMDSINPQSLSSLNLHKLDIFTRRTPLMIMEYPTSALTTANLKSELTLLEKNHHFHPDLIIIDSPNLMSLDSKNLRIDMGRLFKELRGIGFERYAAIIAPHHANREGEGARLLVERHCAEDDSIGRTADNVFSLNQTKAEENLHLMRVFVPKFRSGEGKRLAVISQAYAIGQFCMTSALAPGRVYADELERIAPEPDDDANGRRGSGRH